MSANSDPIDITPTLLLRAYASGVFPMAESAGSDDIYWVDPKFRGVIPLDKFHVSRSMRRFTRNADYVVRVNSDFTGTVAGCADRPETWINPKITELYYSLHRLGYAHSVEIWSQGEMVGGVYGVSISGAFFGESMFSRRTNMSKLALIWLVARLRYGGFKLFDAQFITEHLSSLGAEEISRANYQERLAYALEEPADFFAMPNDMERDQVLHLSTQMS